MDKSLLPNSPVLSAATTIDAREAVPAARRLWLAEPLIWLYAATLFASAFLLFWLQPLVAKMLLPRLGGAPAVWNTALMFFQVVLLAGYVYAHLLSRCVAAKTQPWIHAAVIFVAFTFLPLSVGGAAPASDEAPVLWLIEKLALNIGLPFFALSASAPLLQAWFARTGHRHAQDPYFLYGASNLGSFVALLGFPVLFEPWLSIADQSRLWMLLFVAFAAFLAGCALWSPRGMTRAAEIVPDIAKSAPSVAASSRAAEIWRERALWIALAFVPSSLLLGVTSFITTDVASAPLLWIAPLALYLLSFVVTFARRPLLPMSWSLLGQAGAISIVLLLLPLPAPSLALVIAAHFAAFFLTALVCHGALAARRPATSRLTEFYICMSLGGALGGIANALIAPVVFSGAYEYPLALVLACALRQAASPTPRRLGWRDIAAPLGLFAIVLAILLGWNRLGDSALPLQAAGLILPPLSVLFFRAHGVRFALAVAAVLVPFMIAHNSPGLLHQERSFFGVYRVKLDPDAPIIDLIDGTVQHGAEATDPAHWRDVLSYYDPAGPIGQYFTALHAVSPSGQRVGVIGLGTGALACYARPGEDWTFYEIDPAVLRIAEDTRYFHYLEQCGAGRIVLGDARVSLTRDPPARYDLLVLDAFSSDAIPMHLLTREALQLYLAKLGEHGTIVMHVSNSHLQLWPMLDDLARQLGLATRHQLFMPTPAQKAGGARASEWIAFARADADLSFLDGTTPGWKSEHPSKDVAGWSDDFSNLLSVMRW